MLGSPPKGRGNLEIKRKRKKLNKEKREINEEEKRGTKCSRGKRRKKVDKVRLQRNL